MSAALVAGPSSQPLVQCHGRLQPVQMLVSLRQFGRAGAGLHPLRAWPPAAALSAAQAAHTSCSWAPVAPGSVQQPRSWRRNALQQLHTLDGSGGGGGGDGPPSTAAAAHASSARLINPGEVHTFWLDPSKVVSEAELQSCAALLTAEELQECSSSEEPAVRRERILARALVRSVLAGYAAEPAPPQHLRFERSARGKPHLLWPSTARGGHQLCFNLTHTASLIGLAVSVDGLVGLDVEGLERRTRRDPMRLAQRRFSQQEIADLQTCPDEPSRAACFLQLWTLKEAYVKALGRGISAPPGLRSFSFRVSSQQQQQQQQHHHHQQQGVAFGHAGTAAGSDMKQASMLHSQTWQPGGPDGTHSTSSSNSGSICFASSAPEPRRWQFALLQPDAGHLAALCIERPGEPIPAPHQQRHDSDEQQQPAQVPQQPQAPLRVLHFQAGLPGSPERLFEPRLLASGLYP